MGSIDFGSERAYWYETTIRSAEKAGLPVRSRPAANRDEALQAREIRRHIDRITVATTTPASSPAAEAPTARSLPDSSFCGQCGVSFTRAQWRARAQPTSKLRLYRVIYPRNGGRIELYRHLLCPVKVVPEGGI